MARMDAGYGIGLEGVQMVLVAIEEALLIWSTATLIPLVKSAHL